MITNGVLNNKAATISIVSLVNNKLLSMMGLNEGSCSEVL
jgi:hypothetical protein